ncbi:MAG: hypothetical protein UZ18_ATM001002506 [Armatimonadetes bacterium OLB18]|nr:MAG: hypothetical protein UZ18_ATM001002506 [Armatimonadetes bacterium OLB18]
MSTLVPPGGGDFEGADRRTLALHVRVVHLVRGERRFVARFDRHRPQQRRPVQDLDHLLEAVEAKHGDRGGERRLAGALRGEEKARETPLHRKNRRAHRSVDGSELSIQSQLA